MLGNGISLFFLILSTSTSLWPVGPVVLLSHGRGALVGRVWGEEQRERPGDQKEPEG